MSRVRILNLPSDCTEEQLKQHLLRTAPPDAPPLDITDVQFIRRPANAKDREHHKKQQQQHKGVAQRAGSERGESKMVLRMTFVGFRTSAAGHFVAKYFDKTFFGSARISVEAAKGLNDVGVTVNQRLKQASTEAKQKTNQSKKALRDGGHPAAADERGRKRHRAEGDATGPDSHPDTTPKHDAEEEKPKHTGDNTRERRQREFVEQRSKATEGPTWASEVLLAPNSETAQGSSSALEENDPSTSTVEASTKGNAKPVKGSTVHNGSMAPAAGKEEEEKERQALARQQELGAMDDMDFLAGLGGSGGGGDDRANVANTASADMSPLMAVSVDAGQDEEQEREQEKDVMHSDAMRNSSIKPGVGSAEPQEGKSAPDVEMVVTTTPEEQEGIARTSQRIRLGNIPYVATEEHVKQFAASLVGPVVAVHIPLTKDTRQNKGAAFVRFVLAEDAVRALSLCRGAIMMGRLLRVSAAEEDPHSRRVLEHEAALATTSGGPSARPHQPVDGSSGGGSSLPGSSPFKKQRETDKRAGQQQQVAWNTMYMNSNAAVDAVAQRLGVRSEDVVGVAAKGAAVRAAIAEAYLTSEVQQVLTDEGIAFDLIEGAAQNLLKTRSNTTILVKNLQLTDGNAAAALTKMFVRFGILETSAFPSTGTFALFRFSHPQDARIAFTRLAYKLFGNSPLFLEWAPVGALTEEGEAQQVASATASADLGLISTTSASADGGDAAHGAMDANVSAAHAIIYTAFITNIAFNTTEEALHTFLMDACPRLARAPETLLKRLVLQHEQGRAFLTVADMSTLTYCVARVNGKSFGGRTLSCVVSKQTLQMQQQQQHRAAAAGRGEDEEEGDRRVGSAPGGAAAAAAQAEEEDEDMAKTSVIARRRGGDREDGSFGPSNSNIKVPPGADPLKLIVKNLPFEATEKDVRELFAAFSEIRTVRVPRKTHAFSSHRENNHRGFAFVEFLSEAEAARAMETLRATHLYGRHLVLQYAKLDA